MSDFILDAKQIFDGRVTYTAPDGHAKVQVFAKLDGTSVRIRLREENGIIVKPFTLAFPYDAEGIDFQFGRELTSEELEAIYPDLMTVIGIAERWSDIAKNLYYIEYGDYTSSPRILAKGLLNKDGVTEPSEEKINEIATGICENYSAMLLEHLKSYEETRILVRFFEATHQKMFMG